MKTTAIIPALNEEGNIVNVIKPLLESKLIDRVLVVDDGSTDNTAELSKKAGAEVLSLPKKGGSGKGNAMRKAIEHTDSEIVAFFDADLIGLKEEHIALVVKPVQEGKADMSVGIRVRYGGLSEFMLKIDPLLAIGGERAMKREVFLSIPEEFMQGFAVETALNYYCIIRKLPVAHNRLVGLKVIVKEKKWGFWKGFKNRIKMMKEMVKIRFMLKSLKHQFK